MGHVVLFSSGYIGYTSLSIILCFLCWLRLFIGCIMWLHIMSEAVIDGDSMAVRQRDSGWYTDMINNCMGKTSRSRPVRSKTDVKAYKQLLMLYLYLQEVTPLNHAYSVLCSTRLEDSSICINPWKKLISLTYIFNYHV